MRRDELYLNDIVEAADHIAAFLHDTDFEAFLKSELIRSAVVQNIDYRRGVGAYFNGDN